MNLKKQIQSLKLVSLQNLEGRNFITTKKESQLTFNHKPMTEAH